MEPTPGWYNVSEKDYHTRAGLSKSDMSLLLRSPAHYKYGEKEETKAMTFGSAFHMAILEPHKMGERYLVLPEGETLAKKFGIALKQKAEEEGKEIIRQAEINSFREMRRVLMGIPFFAMAMDSDPKFELSGYWEEVVVYDEKEDKRRKILCKMRPDIINAWPICAIVDLKSTEDARSGPFFRVADSKGHQIQAAHYLKGAETLTNEPYKDFYFIAIERDTPHGVQVYHVDTQAPDHSAYVQDGQKQREKAMKIYAKCLNDNSWPCYSTDVQQMDLPNWKKFKPRRESLEIYD